MARYDQATSDFINKIAGSEVKKDPAEPKDLGDQTKDALSKARLAVKLYKDPAGTSSKSLVRKATAELLKMAKVDVLKIYQILMDEFKTSWFGWEPETIWQSLADRGVTDPKDEVKNIVMALQVAVTTNTPFEHWHIFEKVAQAFSQNKVDFGLVQPLELTEAAKAFKILKVLRPKQEFEKEVHGYVASVAKSSGVVYLPPELFSEEANKELEAMSYNKELSQTTKAAWLKDKKSDDPVIGHQLNMLTEISEFVKNG